MPRWFVLPVVLCAATVTAAASPRGYTVARWSVDDGLPNNAVTSLIQSRNGYLWIATWAGIARFDGVRFTPVAENLPNAHATGLFEDRSGAVWIAVSGTGLVRVEGHRREIFTPAQGLGGNDVRAIAQDADGRIWAGGENGVSVIENGQVKTLREAPGLRSANVTSLARGRDGRMWIAIGDAVCNVTVAGLRCDRPHRFSGHPTAVLEDAAGRLWIGTDSGLFAEGGGPCGADRCFAGHPVSALHEARDGSVWAGLDDGRVGVVGDGVASTYGAAEGLPTGGPVVSLLEDREGSIWAAIYNAGLARLRPRRVATYSTADGLPTKVVGSIVQDAGGTIWAGTQCGPVSEWRGDRFIPRFREATNGACAWATWAARDGALWIGTRDNGLFRWKDGRMEHFGRQEGLSDSLIAALFEDRDGVIWIGTNFGGLHTYAGGRLSRAYGPADGVASGYINSFAQDRDGRVWIGSNANGLSVYENGRFRILGPNESPPSRNIAGLLVDSRGDLWIGTAADGLFRRRHGRYERFGVDQGLGDRLVAVMIEDAGANLWVATTRGIARLARERIEEVADGRRASLDPMTLDRTDGLLTLEGSGGGVDPSGLRDREGRLWFSTIDGIAVVDPAVFPMNTVPPPVLVEAVTLSDRPASPRADGAIDVPAGTASIAISYTAFSFLQPDKVRFRYRLNGLDTDWQAAGSRRTAFYSRLPPGRYVFDVLAANSDGVWSTAPVTLQLVVRPFWWERRSVQAAGLVLLLVATGLGVRSVSQRRARARVEELERENALAGERSRIARDLHDDLGSRLLHIALMADASPVAANTPQIARSARAAVQTMDELVWSISARHDTVESFATYAAQFTEEHAAAAGLACRLRIQPDLDARPLAADTRRHLYLAFKEAVTNALKHARASEVTVAVHLDADALVVEVADNGCGLPPGAADPTGNGLENMRERMAAVRGRLEVDSTAGTGTRITLRTPL